MLVNKFKTAIIATTIAAIAGTKGSVFAAPGNNHPAELKFIGHSGNIPVFQLVLNNSANALYVITVRDSEKNILLTEKLKGEKIYRQYKLNAEEPGRVSGTTFEVTNMATKETEIYEISSKNTVVENVSVQPIK